ncbi:recombinase family protein [Actinokineospora guangxiensis]|uniref:Recombinase family protein n=1 Tax=Actinokineospora guangxiensis TaxID=1490288 RepID=A0ABW0ESS0_9PSEU
MADQGKQAKRTRSTRHQDRKRPARALVLDSYARLSQVPETGELEKIDDQHTDNRRVIAAAGAVVGLELDDGLSAWKRGVRRPDFERLLERVESGESDGCAVWHTDRLFRQPKDLERLIDLAERGFVILSAHGARNLANSDDRFILRIEVAQAAKSSDDTSRRLKRRFQGMRERGRAHTGGRRRVGFSGLEPPGHGTGPNGERLPVSKALIAKERAAIKDAIRGHLAGISLGEYARRWNEAGLRTSTGQRFIATTVKTTLLRPELAGIIEHDGVVVGRVRGKPLIAPEVFERFRALVTSRKSGPPVGLRYLGSGLLRCGVCGAKMFGRNDGQRLYSDGEKRRRYMCSSRHGGCGKINIDARGADREIKSFALARLSDPASAAELARGSARRSERIAELQDTLSTIETIQKSLSGRLGVRKMTLAAFDEAMEPLARDHTAATTELDALLSAPSDETATRAEAVEEWEARWEDSDLPGRRALFARALGDATWLVVDPSGPLRNRFDPSRMRPCEPFRRGADTRST